MDNRSFESASSATPPIAPITPSIGYPTNGNPSLAIPATKPGDYWFHQIGEELRNVIIGAGLTPAPGTLNQLYLAIQSLVGGQAGVVLITSGTTAQTGTVKANGSLLNRVAYAALWAFAQASGNITASDAAWSVGTTPGKYSPGDGLTTFRIPDLRGLFLRNFDDGAGIDSGRVFGSYQLDDFKAHTHTTLFDPTIGSVVAGGAGLAYQNTFPTSSTGGSETRPKNTALLACIKY